MLYKKSPSESDALVRDGKGLNMKQAIKEPGKPLKLSIVIPVYNVASYLKDCLASLMVQPYESEMEFVVIDDGSTDGSAEMLDEVALSDSRFHVIHQKNQGVSAARNKGLDEALGEYIAWVDSDDMITPDWYVSIRPYIMKGAELIYFDLEEFGTGKRQVYSFDSDSRIIPHYEWCEELSYDLSIQSHLCSKVFKKTLFDETIRFSTDYSYCEDYQIMHRLTFPVKEVDYIHKVLYLYRNREGSIVHVGGDGEIDNLMAAIQLWKARAAFFRERNLFFRPIGRLRLELELLWSFGSSPKIKEVRRVFRDDLRRNFWTVMRSPSLGIKRKVKGLLAMYDLDRLFRFLWGCVKEKRISEEGS